jgi:ubiquitin-conjugating enzyme E2 J2
MATKQAYKRLTKEYIAIQNSPPPFIIARPSEKNILEWHYVITGPADSPYAKGQYWGVLLFPSEYPYKPPAIKMMTPNGRFATNERLCLSISDFHPSTWNPSWSVSTILTGLLSFMLEDTPTTGSITTTKEDKILLAAQSKLWNARNPKFRDLFPELSLPSLTQSAALTSLVANGNGNVHASNATRDLRADNNINDNNNNNVGGGGLFGTGLFRQRNRGQQVAANVGNNDNARNVNINNNNNANQPVMMEPNAWKYWGQFIWNLLRICSVVIFIYVLIVKLFVAWGWL